MRENNLSDNTNPADQRRLFNAEFSDLPSIVPGTGNQPKPKFIGNELDAMCKNPRQSAELIRYLIEFIKSL
jgi:hypothetical protein